MWGRVLEALQREADQRGQIDWGTHFVDGTVVRAHQHAAGALGGPAHEALGCSRGGFSTKVHLRVEGGGKLYAGCSSADGSTPSFRAARTSGLTTGAIVHSTVSHTASATGSSASSID